MPGNSNPKPRRPHLLSRPTVLAAGIALAVTVATGVFAEYQNRIVHHQGARVKVSEQLGLVRAKLEGNITSNIQLVRGLVSVIATQPAMDQVQFSKIAAGLVGEHSQLRNIAGAPGMVISLMYPVEGNEKAIGLDYRRNEMQREAALRAVASKQMVLAGPVNLLQGGQGFVGRFPVFVENQSGDRHLWGLVAAVVDTERLYAASGLSDLNLPLKIAIRGQDATGETGAVFFGDPGIFGDEPVTSQVSLPSGSWQIAAVPAGGWSTTPDNAWQIRSVILLAGLLVILPILIAGYLNDIRQTHIQEINRATRSAPAIVAEAQACAGNIENRRSGSQPRHLGNQLGHTDPGAFRSHR
ncbi:CHASE domain-containing protein [Hoeflea alexandrii]|uniref:CHASE domain-containing protein n=1 Tax=Hoeflea alexandrii TaxID=288436 RepID=UPI00226ED318|nr:CHASE domain-containing protein [Hoeflea alexandrii]MCY0152522.1 CHASE domain-containing protein [Hoeflea alexandrii]